MPQATRSDDHRTYRCYLRGPDGIRELSPCGPGAPLKLFLGTWAVNDSTGAGASPRASCQTFPTRASRASKRPRRARSA